MAASSARERQRVVDEYLNESGRNQFVPREFLTCLRERPDHPVHPVFFGMDDAEAAQAWREGRVRHWVSGLRIAVRVTEAIPSAVSGVVVRQLPAMVSPVAGRSSGGGYAPVDPSDPAMVAELRRQAQGRSTAGSAAMRASPSSPTSTRRRSGKSPPISRAAWRSRRDSAAAGHGAATWGGHGEPRSPQRQQEGKDCPAHLFLPALVPGVQVDADPEIETVTYRMRDGAVWVDGATGEAA